VFEVTGLDATGAVDVTEGLRAFLASVPDGSVIRLPAGAKYRVEGVFLVQNRRDLTFEGNGATIFATTSGATAPYPTSMFKPLWPRKRVHIAVLGGGGHVFRNLNIVGPHANAGGLRDYIPQLEAQHGFDILGVDGLEMDHVSIRNVYGDFVHLGNFGTGVIDTATGLQTRAWSKNIYIHDSHFQGAGRQGIAFTATEDVRIERNYIGNVSRSMLDIEPDGDRAGIRRLMVRDNTFGPAINHFLAGHGSKGASEDVTVENNRLQNARMIISTENEGNRRKNWRIVGNVSDRITGTPVPLMRFYLIDGLVVRGNVQTLNPNQPTIGVYVSDSCGVDVGGNSFPGATAEYDVGATAAACTQ
jgi:hypothetical protein